MIEKQFKLKHYIALGLLLIAIVISAIQPLEFEAYLLHQAGTVFMLILLFVIF
ncbi:putative membrane protein [Acinetobacter sp. 1295259]|nr:putative membrane protein [Acinetobacter sp. 1295259]